MTRRLLSAAAAPAVLALLLSACTGDRPGRPSVANFQRLQIDQTEAQAVELLGPPAQTADEKGERTLTWADGNLRITARFRDGKLTRREGLLDGLPLVPDEAGNKPVQSPGDRNAARPAEAPEPESPAKLIVGQSVKKFKDIHARARAYATTEWSAGAQEGFGGINSPSETAANGGIMVGMVVHLNQIAGVGDYISGLQALWLNDRGAIVRGKLIGKVGRGRTELQARRGYAVCSVQVVRDADMYYGLSLSYKAITGDVLDPTSEYTSERAGGKGPELRSFERFVTANDFPIYGYECHFSAAVDTPGATKWLRGIKIYIACAPNEH